MFCHSILNLLTVFFNITEHKCFRFKLSGACHTASSPNAMTPTTQPVVSSNSPSQSGNSTPSSLHTESRPGEANDTGSFTSRSTAVGTRSSAIVESWVANFEIPWAKCPDSLLAAIDIENPKPPSASDIRKLVAHTVSDVFVHTKRAIRSSLHLIASKIVCRSPRAFADYINGQMVGDGINSLMLMPESKKENLNRREGSSVRHELDGQHQTKSHAQPQPIDMTSGTSDGKSDKGRSRCYQFQKYGCVMWHLALSEGENEESHEKMRQEILILLECQGDPSKMKHLMKLAFCAQRRIVNSGKPVVHVFEQWPLLDEPEYLLDHFQPLTGVDMALQFADAWRKKSYVIYSYVNDTANNHQLLKQTLMDIKAAMTASNLTKTPFDGILFLLMAYFKEDSQNLINFYPVSVF